jgi:hypothetical protein
MAIRLRDLPREFREHALAEQREARDAARGFYNAVAAGDDPDALEDAMLWLNETLGGWNRAMRSIKSLPRPSDEVRRRFLMFWIEASTLPRKVGNRRTMVDGLRILLPGNYDGPGLQVYRGTRRREYRARRYNISWTTDLGTAREFARACSDGPVSKLGHGADPNWEGVILETVAPAEAILHVRGNELTFENGAGEVRFDEGEVIVDPFKLHRVTAIERLPLQDAAIAER